MSNRRKLPGQPVKFVPPPDPGIALNVGDIPRSEFGNVPEGMVDVMPHNGEYPAADEIAYAAQYRCDQRNGRVIAMTFREDAGLSAQ